MSRDIHKLILTTIAYYDLFDFPLTIEEIKKYLTSPDYLKIGSDIEDNAINIGLYSLINSNEINLTDGFYTLPNREHLVAIRFRNTKISIKKMKRARFASFLMSALPYIQAVFASGSLALGNTNHDSDLDLFIIAKGGRIWTARFVVNVLFDVLHLKRKPQDRVAPNKLCLNHYIADNALQIKNQNIFTAHVYANLDPLYLRDPKILQNFIKENDWVKCYLRHWDFQKNHLVKNHSLLRFTKKAREWVLNSKLGDLLESVVRRYQIKRIELNPLTSNPRGRIEYNSRQLEFHPHSIENSILVKFADLIKTL